MALVRGVMRCSMSAGSMHSVWGWIAAKTTLAPSENACSVEAQYVTDGVSGSLSPLDWRYYNPGAVENRELRSATPPRQYEKPETLPWIEMRADIAPNDPPQEFYNRLFAAIRHQAPSPAPSAEVEQLLALFDACRERPHCAAGVVPL